MHVGKRQRKMLHESRALVPRYSWCQSAAYILLLGFHAVGPSDEYRAQDERVHPRKRHFNSGSPHFIYMVFRKNQNIFKGVFIPDKNNKIACTLILMKRWENSRQFAPAQKKAPTSIHLHACRAPLFLSKTTSSTPSCLPSHSRGISIGCSPTKKTHFPSSTNLRHKVSRRPAHTRYRALRLPTLTERHPDVPTHSTRAVWPPLRGKKKEEKLGKQNHTHTPNMYETFPCAHPSARLKLTVVRTHATTKKTYKAQRSSCF